jgi:hypothetical protein
MGYLAFPVTLLSRRHLWLIRRLEVCALGQSLPIEPRLYCIATDAERVLVSRA